MNTTYISDKKPPTPVMKEGKLEQFMPKIGGVSFRCSCTCNVFHKPDDTKPNLYECNACGQWYEGA